MGGSLKIAKAILYILLSVLCLTGCTKGTEKGNVVIESYKYVVEQVSTHCYEVNAEGKVRNIGKYDVKNVIVSGNCLSCQQKMVEGLWFNSPDIPKPNDQKAIINYLVPGAEASFRFESIANILTDAKPTESDLPKKMEVVIESFETVQP